MNNQVINIIFNISIQSIFLPFNTYILIIKLFIHILTLQWNQPRKYTNDSLIQIDKQQEHLFIYQITMKLFISITITYNIYFN